MLDAARRNSITRGLFFTYTLYTAGPNSTSNMMSCRSSFCVVAWTRVSSKSSTIVTGGDPSAFGGRQGTDIWDLCTVSIGRAAINAYWLNSSVESTVSSSSSTCVVCCSLTPSSALPVLSTLHVPSVFSPPTVSDMAWSISIAVVLSSSTPASSSSFLCSSSDVSRSFFLSSSISSRSSSSLPLPAVSSSLPLLSPSLPMPSFLLFLGTGERRGTLASAITLSNAASAFSSTSFSFSFCFSLASE
mmetsp:Transcript_48035/g.124774  ORF Transcript_48035/g.124774 Transcript_48035/m.124774 type:complete len:245 (-) Transcript_48035:671-1405(-)